MQKSGAWGPRSGPLTEVSTHRQRGCAAGGVGNFRMHGSSRSSASYSAMTWCRYCFLGRERAPEDLGGQGLLSSLSGELRSEGMGPGATHEDLTGLPPLRPFISAASTSKRRAPEDGKPSVSCPELSPESLNGHHQVLSMLPLSGSYASYFYARLPQTPSCRGVQRRRRYPLPSPLF